jgi:hypothetical protein
MHHESWSAAASSIRCASSCRAAARLRSVDGRLEKQRDRVEDMMIRKATGNSGGAGWN